MAKATVDGTIPCKKCGNTMTVENQKWTGGPDREREFMLSVSVARQKHW